MENFLELQIHIDHHSFEKYTPRIDLSLERCGSMLYLKWTFSAKESRMAGMICTIK